MRSYPSHTAPTSSHTSERSTVTAMRRVKVALYVRVSTDKQAEFGMSLDAQTAELERYCAERSWDVAETFVDGGFSAKDTERPAYQRMVKRIKDGGIDAIAVTKLDRLTRSVRNLCEINEDILKGLGVHLVCTRDGINTFELTSSFLMHLLALIGQIERENTSKRVAAAIEHIHDNGGHYGKIPFGKMTVPHPTQPKMKVLVDHPEESIWLNKIFEWYKAGKQHTEIANLLNANGVKPRYCDRWNLQIVFSLLRVNRLHKARSADSPFVYDRHKAYKLAIGLRQDGARLRTIADALTQAQLRPKNAQRYTCSSTQDLLRGSILHNINTAQGLALHLKETGHSLRDICDKLLAKGFCAPRGGRWYPKTVADLMKREDDGVYSGSRRTG